jgi:hypothetical protein
MFGIIMEAYLLIFLIIGVLFLGARNYKEHLTQLTARAAEAGRPPIPRVATSVASTTVTQTIPDGMRRAIQAYRDNYVAYNVTGKEAHKTAYLSAQAQIERFIRDADTKIQRDAAYVDRFVKEYADANPELLRYKRMAEDVQRQGPEIEGQYMVEKKLNEPVEVDMKPFYIKLAVALLIGGVGAVALFLR